MITDPAVTTFSEQQAPGRERWSKGIDLSRNHLPYWRSLVVRGRELADKTVPVVMFHDWGFGDPPFPWLAVRTSEREVWMRTRGAETYAAGAFFAFPVLGPFGCDAARDGTLPVIARQAAFYQSHRGLYLRSRWLGCEQPTADTDPVSLAAWWAPHTQGIVLHVINRAVTEGELHALERLTVRLPVTEAPVRAAVISPDFAGERRAAWRLVDGDLDGFLQGMLHSHLRNPPTFLVHADKEAELLVHIMSVAGADAGLYSSSPSSSPGKKLS